MKRTYYVPLNDVEIGVCLLDELDRAMSYHIHILKWSDGSFCYHWSSLLPLGNQRASEWKDDFLSFATSGRLYKYVKWKVDSRYRTIMRVRKTIIRLLIRYLILLLNR
jgi:hypothetical protein